MTQYEIIVGNIGTVYTGTNGFEANKTFNQYRSASMSPHGRASGESVTLLKDGEVVREYVGSRED
jgi:hypothetical protein